MLPLATRCHYPTHFFRTAQALQGTDLQSVDLDPKQHQQSPENSLEIQTSSPAQTSIKLCTIHPPGGTSLRTPARGHQSAPDPVSVSLTLIFLEQRALRPVLCYSGEMSGRRNWVCGSARGASPKAQGKDKE